MYEFENSLKQQGYKYIVGTDEVGRGPMAGPLVVACVLLPEGEIIEGLNDSKKLTAKKREQLALIIKEKAIEYQIQYMTVEEVDRLNVYEASRQAMMMCVRKMKHQVDYVLSDAMPLNFEFPCLSIIKGDSKSASIAAASIIAKVERDHYMEQLDNDFPMYGFKKHKGYVTKAHLQAIKEHGVCEHHRVSFAPVKEVIMRNAE